MTIGIAAHFDKGLVLCSDTKLVNPSGLTSSRSKQSVSAFATKQMFISAYAGDDAEAAEALCREIVSAAGDVEHPHEFDRAVKKTMSQWWRAYGQVKPPELEFLIAHVSVKDGYSQILKCSPPGTINRPTGAVAIGCGAEIVGHYPGLLWPRPSSPVRYHPLKTVLLRLAYLMKLAKERDGQFVGGRTDVAVISEVGSFTFIDRDEMEKAEKFAASADKLLEKIAAQILSADADDGDDLADADKLAKEHADLMIRRKDVSFSHLDLLEKSVWRRARTKKLTPQT